MYSDNLVLTLNVIANEYALIIYQRILEVLNQPKYKRTGAGADSVKVEVVPGTTNKSPDIRIEFADHVNLINLPRMQWTKQPPVDDMTEWAKTVTFTGPVPGYKNGIAPNLPPWKANLRRIWAIAKSKQKFDTWKAKPWRKKSLGSVLKEMNELVLKKFEEAIQLDFEKAVKI